RLTVTQTGVIKGTLAYMSPEQARGRTVDARSDVFGVGAVLHELCLAEPPYPDGPPAEPRPVEIGSNLPPAVAAIIARATAWELDARFASAAEMLAAVRATGIPVATEDEVAAWGRGLRAGQTVGAEALPEASTRQEFRTRMCLPGGGLGARDLAQFRLEDDLEAPVALAALGGRVARPGVVLAVARRDQAPRRHALGDEELGHHHGARCAQLPVVVERALHDRHVVGVARDGEAAAPHAAQDRGNLAP